MRVMNTCTYIYININVCIFYKYTEKKSRKKIFSPCLHLLYSSRISSNDGTIEERRTFVLFCFEKKEFSFLVFVFVYSSMNIIEQWNESQMLDVQKQKPEGRNTNHRSFSCTVASILSLLFLFCYRTFDIRPCDKIHTYTYVSPCVHYWNKSLITIVFLLSLVDKLLFGL